jgi:two-component system CheB/CheR fusion protein
MLDEKELNEKFYNNFPIVGIGASAGGLEAFELFLENIKNENEVAYVFVQHLDPNHKSLLGEIIKRYTQLPIIEITDNLPINTKTIYINPPSKNLEIKNQKFKLIEFKKPHSLNLPIDYFFRALSSEQKEKSICIVLSGTGTDGTLGLTAIKGVGGMTIVQDPSSAKFDGMPKSAISTNLVDFVLKPNEMNTIITEFIQNSGYVIKKDFISEEKISEYLKKIFILIHTKSGNDFSNYKLNTIIRRIEKRMVINQISQINEYFLYLQNNHKEIDYLQRELLIGVTSFFRDEEAFQFLSSELIPNIFKKNIKNDPIRIWVAGCSTGEEAYSLAMLFQEYQEKNDINNKIQIFASDIDNLAIEKARIGLYPEGIAIDVPDNILKKYFTREQNNYQIKKQIREMIIFASQNVISDPPFSKIDLISCRNLLIYLESEIQQKVFSLFHYSLKTTGYLLLGSSESTGLSNTLFSTLNLKYKIFKRNLSPIDRSSLFDVPIFGNFSKIIPGPTFLGNKKVSYAKLINNLLLKDYTPPCVIVDENSEILYLHGETNKFLQPPSGDATFNIIGMVKNSLKTELITALRKTIQTDEETIFKKLVVDVNDTNKLINLKVIPIKDSEYMKGLMLIIFEEIDNKSVDMTELELNNDEIDVFRKKSIVQLEGELNSTKEYLRSTIEELETTNEELKSANEELQSSNEELQSTNEELGTSKEELQSVNEELVTVNSELQNKLEELTQANNDMNNLLANTNNATVFLNLNFQIVRYTPAVTKVINLIPADIGRNIKDITLNIDYPNLIQDINEVYSDLVPKKFECKSFSGNWYIINIRAYRTMDNVINGVVLTFNEITEEKIEKLKFTSQIEMIFNFVQIGLFIFEFNSPERFILVTINPIGESYLNIDKKLLIGKNFQELWEENFFSINEVMKVHLSKKVFEREIKHEKGNFISGEFLIRIFYISDTFVGMSINKKY